MRKYVALILLAVLTVVVVVRLTHEKEREQRVPEKRAENGKKDEPFVEMGWKEKARTRTALHENEALRELERTLQREDLSRAYAFRQRVCEQMSTILKNEKLTQNLLLAIKEYGLGDDAKRRALMLPILRVMDHPEATALIEQAYFGARNEEERLLMLEAMAHEYHDPKRASVWAVDRALHGETKEQRQRAFYVIQEFSNNQPVILDTALQIYAQTKHEDQALDMINAVVGTALGIDKARAWLRREIQGAKGDRLGAMVQHIDTWGTEQDAADLELLATKRPAMADFLRERAKAIRDAVREREGREPIVDEEAEKKKAREGKGEGDDTDG